MTDDAAELRVVLVRSKSSANVGAAARAMKNFGLHELVLVAPRCEVDREARALASHAGDVLDASRVVATLDDALVGTTWAVATTARERASGAVPDLTPDEGLATLPAHGGALVFGPEDHGLSNQELDRCGVAIRIPTAAYASINLAQAVNLLAHRWFERRRAEAPQVAVPEAAEREQMEAMYAQLLSLWHLIGFTDEIREEATLRMFRSIFDRARLDRRELAALRGLWAQAAWAAEREPHRLPRRSGGGGKGSGRRSGSGAGSR